MGPLWNRLTDK